MKRLYFHRRLGFEITVRAFGRWWGFSYAKKGRFGNGRRWIFMRPAKCLCAWYGPDLYDGCSACGKGAE